MDELLQEFISETQESLEALAGEIIAWEADPSDRGRLDAIFRFFHTVKGSCGFLHLPRFERLSHAAEDVLSDIRSGKRHPDAATVNAVLGIMDRIAELTQAVAVGAPLAQEDDEYLVAALAVHESESEAESDAPAPVPRHGSAQAAPRTIRLPLALIDQLMNGVSDMVLARNELARQLRDRAGDPALEGAFERLSGCVAEMRDAISRTRMQRIDRLFAAIPRTVRDLGRDLGKRIELSLEGGDVEMDREMVEMVVDPLIHIVRNSIDHGIETPERRRALGKPETGQLRLEARQSGNQIVIEISDDGAGIDTARLVEKAIAAGRLTPDAAARMNEAERLDLIFQAGLSTASAVTAVSGRGVGMDVVRANVERIGGTIGLDNHPGRGLRITLSVPLTLTIIPGLVLRAGGLHFAIPRAAVVEILHDNNAMLRIGEVGGARIATIRDVRHSMIDLEDVLGLDIPAEPGPRTVMVVRSASGLPFALGVSAVENHEELVIRPASPIVMASGIYAGMTLPDNGKPMLLLDTGGLARKADLSEIAEHADAVRTAGERTDAKEGTEMVAALRFEELSGERRLLQLSLIERVEELEADLFGHSGDRAFVRLKDRLVPVVNGCQGFARETVSALRLRDDRREAYYAVAAVLDIVQMPAVPDMVAMHGNLSGVCVVEGEHLEVLNPFALFASLPDEPAERKHPGRCLLADAEDGWAREILAPLLRQAGHEVLIGLPEGAAVDPSDIVLCTTSDAMQAADVLGCRTVQLRAAPQPSGPQDASIYRYDRRALMAAIAGAGQ
ncbi:two-component system chemotaxis sensor kinase CheA [Sphingobium wenxiniae]|uniref:Chemotaxis protein CheA n=1 Tax=Sphingobium wenxiniae (strain DSM 21828 / CGMCC 1.7748 / JZ-1) TaxID=595605 RepID=A0A562KG16_SPHWJ|nr:ATP-binding protein [Sphingobium wenxiniae]MBB6190591.1 two-component system chemotaxis sensor kinase CheA [Sphingobium wenxiniae]TWH94369.1 two-component system chemotaxis sensor kinase CheA [Sphingobium wenxiniae]